MYREEAAIKYSATKILLVVCLLAIWALANHEAHISTFLFLGRKETKQYFFLQ